MQFDLPAQPLADSLRAVAARTNSNILFDRDLVAGLEAKPLKGEATTEQALQQLLTGTDLTDRRLDARTVTIVTAPAPGQKAWAQGDAAKPIAEDAHAGSDSVRLARADNRAASSFERGSARKGEMGASRWTEQQGTGLEAVVITGSRLAPLGFSEPTPVTVITAAELRLAGTVNTEQLLEAAPQFLGSQNNDATGNTVPGGTATLNLRGFGAQRNLVLVNGRRFAISGPDETTDINTIPAALIERVEVVTGGSSAVYGSDAITGVVNFIMRDDFEGAEVNARAGATLTRPHPSITSISRRRTIRRRARKHRGFDKLSRARLDQPAPTRRLGLLPVTGRLRDSRLRESDGSRCSIVFRPDPTVRPPGASPDSWPAAAATSRTVASPARRQLVRSVPMRPWMQRCSAPASGGWAPAASLSIAPAGMRVLPRPRRMTTISGHPTT